MSGIDSEDNAAQISYASFGRRLLAWLIDSLIMSIFIVPVMIIATIADVILVASVLGPNARSSPFFGGIGYVFWVGFGFCLPLLWLYYAWMESSAKRATLGKRICRLQVVSQQGKTEGFYPYLESIRTYGWICVFNLFIGNDNGLFDERRDREFRFFSRYICG